jgi:hydroxymethylbilane synthase
MERHMTPSTIRIGTRGSPMALAQTRLIRDRLAAAHPGLAAPGAIEIVVITAMGDQVLDRPLADIGGKGLFTKEIDQALLDHRIDLAVHSLKDVETFIPAGLTIACVPPRDDPRDAFLSPVAASLGELPAGARVGTSSLRRQAQVLMVRPDLQVVPLRGNANTRLRKLAEGQCDATLLAICGLRRIDLESEARCVLPVSEMLPAVAQGALGVECRQEDEALIEMLSPLRCPVSTACVETERALLAALDGSCRTPVAALAEIEGDELRLRGFLAAPDGRLHWSVEHRGSAKDALAVGTEAGRELRAAAEASPTAKLW